MVSGDDGDSLLVFEQLGCAAEPSPPDTDCLRRQAYRLGLLQALITMVRDGIREQTTDGTTHAGERFSLAEMAIALTTARELVHQADPDHGVDLALAAVAARDALSAGISLASTVVTAGQWPSFITLRDIAETDLRRDPTGRADLEEVAAAALGGLDLVGAVR